MLIGVGLIILGITALFYARKLYPERNELLKTIMNHDGDETDELRKEIHADNAKRKLWDFGAAALIVVGLVLAFM